MLTAQSVGEALARGDSRRAADLVMETMSTYYAHCTWCGRETLRYKTNGICIGCGTQTG